MRTYHIIMNQQQLELIDRLLKAEIQRQGKGAMRPEYDGSDEDELLVMECLSTDTLAYPIIYPDDPPDLQHGWCL